MGNFVENEDELQHHGIRGQKWGIRRFQNYDGTRTPAGKKREQEGSSEGSQNNSPSTSKSISIDKKQLAKGAAIAGAVALGAVLITNPGARNLVGKYGKTAMVNLGSAAGKGAAKFMNKAESRMDKVADAMIDAALLSAGGIAISKVTDKLAVGENATEAQKNTSKIATDVVTAGIRTATGAGGGSGSASNGIKGGSVGKEVSDKIGAPSKKSIDKQSAEWQALFKDANGNQRDADTRATIKSLASAGYDIEQIDKYLNHSFEDWASQYFAVEIGW